jgi:hypothetical protein
MKLFLKNINILKKFKTKRKIRIDLFLKNLKLLEDVARCFVDVDTFEQRTRMNYL